MNDQNQTGTKRTFKRWGKGCLQWLGASFVLLMVLMLVGYIYEPIAEAADEKAYPPPGQMVDVGGYSLHINCTGEGSPTVVIEAGWGDSSAGWAWVQPEVAKTTRVCTYDRAGMGWSEASPEPRMAREYARELHTLLANAHEPGPYVLVGHSMGGFTILVYAHDYPDEVSGLVLVDSQALPAADAAWSAVPKPGGTSPASWMARIGLVRLLAGPLGAIQELPPEAKQAYTAYSVTTGSAQTQWDEFLECVCKIGKEENRGDGNHGSKIGSSFFIASRNAPELLETIDESLNDIPLLVVLFVEWTTTSFVAAPSNGAANMVAMKITS